MIKHGLRKVRTAAETTYGTDPKFGSILKSAGLFQAPGVSVSVSAPFERSALREVMALESIRAEKRIVLNAEFSLGTPANVRQAARALRKLADEIERKFTTTAPKRGALK